MLVQPAGRGAGCCAPAYRRTGGQADSGQGTDQSAGVGVHNAHGGEPLRHETLHHLRPEAGDRPAGRAASARADFRGGGAGAGIERARLDGGHGGRDTDHEGAVRTVVVRCDAQA